MIGVGVSSTGGANPNERGASADVETVFAPVPAAFGFLLGAPLGGLVGFLWSRKGLGGAVGFALVTLACGFAGLVAAGLVGAETRVVVSDDGIEVNHGARPAVLMAGTIFGLALGALIAWQFGPPRDLADSPSRLPA
jgi:hypothetical protein